MEAVDRWRDLLAAVDVDDVRELAEMLAGAPLEGLGAKLGAVVDGAVEALLVSDVGDDFASLLRPTFDRAQDDHTGTVVSGRGVVAAGVLLESLGDDIDAEDVLAEWIGAAVRDASTVSDADRHDFALACVALRQDNRVVELVGGTVPAFEAGQSSAPTSPRSLATSLPPPRRTHACPTSFPRGLRSCSTSPRRCRRGRFAGRVSCTPDTPSTCASPAPNPRT